MQKILSGIMLIGFGIQIVLGILWMCNAFAGFSGFGEGIVCVGAMLLLGFAVCFFMDSIRKNGCVWAKLFGVLSVLTFPFVMQSMVNPDSRILVTAFLLCGAGVVLRLIRDKREAGRSLPVLGYWLLAAVVVIGAACIGKGTPSVSTRLTERMVWTNLYNSYARLPEESRKEIPYRKLTDSTYEVDGIERVLLPALRDKLGEKEAARILKELRHVAWQYEKKQILKEVLWDAAGYAVSPIVVPMQLAGRAYESYTGMNYRELLQPAPRLGKFYTDYSCWWFVVGLLTMLLYQGIKWLRKIKDFNRWNYIVTGVPALAMVVGFTLNGAGRMDYKNTLFVLCSWLIWMTAFLVPQEGGQNEKV